MNQHEGVKEIERKVDGCLLFPIEDCKTEWLYLKIAHPLCNLVEQIPFSLPASCQLICILPRGKGTRICIRALTVADLTVLERAPYSSLLNFIYVGKIILRGRNFIGGSSKRSHT